MIIAWFSCGVTSAVACKIALSLYEDVHHPMTEYRENIPRDKVFIDKEFEKLFSQTWEYWDDNHVIVLRSEFDKLK